MRASDRTTFIRLANKRVPNAVKAISLVGNLANRSNYDYTDVDAQKSEAARAGGGRIQRAVLAEGVGW